MIFATDNCFVDLKLLEKSSSADTRSMVLIALVVMVLEVGSNMFSNCFTKMFISATFELIFFNFKKYFWGDRIDVTLLILHSFLW